MMETVKVTFSNGTLIEMTVDEEDLRNFLLGDEGCSNARNYLKQIWEAGLLKDSDDWNHQLLSQDLNVEIPSLAMSYTSAVEHIEEINQLDDGPSGSQESSKAPLHWSHSATLNLISLYEQHRERFNNTTVRNDIIWRDISKKLEENGFGSPTIRQTMDKWKNLRRKYVEAKDNMGPRSSGKPPTNFKYFNEIDEILSTSAQISPPQIASSMRDPNVATEVHNENQEPNVQNNSRKRKINDRDDQERRHKEMVKVLKDVTDVFSAKLDKLIEKL